MKLNYFAITIGVLAAISAADAQAPLITSQNLKPIIETGLYQVTVQCTFAQLPQQFTTIFEAPVRQIAFTVTLSSSRVGANQIPPAPSVIAAVPVVAATISHTNPVFFKNGGCNQSLITTGRTPLYLTALWTDQHSFQPTQLVQDVSALAGLVAPLAGFFASGPASFLKLDTGTVQSMSGPYSQFLAALSTSSSLTQTTSAIEEGSYVVRTAGGTVTVKISKIASIQEAFKISEIRDSFDFSLQALGQQVQKDPTTCIVIGRGLERYQNLNHTDAVYALARIIVASGISSDKVITCLGTEYGPEVIKDSYFIQYGHMTIDPIAFPDGINTLKLGFSPVRFSEIASAMSMYAAGSSPKSVLDDDFVPQLKVTDLTQQIGNASSTLSADQVIDKLKASSKQYVYFGCNEKDSQVGDDGSTDVASLLAIPKSLKQEDVLLLRVWWKADRPGKLPRITQMFVSDEENVISASLKDWQNRCGGQTIQTIK